MHRFLFSILLFYSSVSFAQTYQVSIDACMKNFLVKEGETQEQFMNTIEQRTKDLEQCVTGLSFPAFSATSMSGQSYSEKNLRGKVVLVNLWFTSCAPCVAEMPLLDELYKKYKGRGFEIVSFCRDPQQQTDEFFREKGSVSYPVFANSKDMMNNQFKLSFGFPTNVFLNRKGEIVKFSVGGPSTKESFERVKNEFTAIIEAELAK